MNESVFCDPPEIVNLADIIDPRREGRKEANEEYRIPSRVRILRNNLIIFEGQERDLSIRRQDILGDIENEAVKAMRIQEQLRNELDAVEERIRHAESRIRESYEELLKAEQNV
ncbi:MAG: hypothetical protein WC468_00820 [Candidatus Paceibacterota bacterium]